MLIVALPWLILVQALVRCRGGPQSVTVLPYDIGTFMAASWSSQEHTSGDYFHWRRIGRWQSSCGRFAFENLDLIWHGIAICHYHHFANISRPSYTNETSACNRQKLFSPYFKLKPGSLAQLIILTSIAEAANNSAEADESGSDDTAESMEEGSSDSYAAGEDEVQKARAFAAALNSSGKSYKEMLCLRPSPSITQHTVCHSDTTRLDNRQKVLD